jgi:flagellar assembly protein FliH
MSEREPTPKHLQTAYQRWELASLASEGTPPLASRASSDETAARLARERSEVQLERESARETGYREGHEAGLREGRQQGHEEGYAQGQAQARVEAQQLMAEMTAILPALAEQYSRELAQAREQVAAQLLALAQDMAHAMLLTALELQPELLLTLIDETLHELPGLQAPATLRLHPADLELVRAARGEALQAAGWRLLADPSLERGGCRMDTASHAVDASLPSRWRRLQQALGQSGDWLGGTT